MGQRFIRLLKLDLRGARGPAISCADQVPDETGPAENGRAQSLFSGETEGYHGLSRKDESTVR
jgi:hypothetical protein